MNAPKEFELHINPNLGQANAAMHAADLAEATLSADDFPLT